MKITLVLTFVLCFVSFNSLRLVDLEEQTYLDEFLDIAFQAIPPASYGGVTKHDGTSVAQKLTFSKSYKLNDEATNPELVVMVEEKEGGREEILTIYRKKKGNEQKDYILFVFIRKDLTCFYKGFYQYKLNIEPENPDQQYPDISVDNMARLVAISEMNQGDNIENAMFVDVDESKVMPNPYVFKFMMNTGWLVYPFSAASVTPKVTTFFDKRMEFMIEPKDSKGSYRFLVKDYDDIVEFDNLGLMTILNYRAFLVLPREFIRRKTIKYSYTSTEKKGYMEWKVAGDEGDELVLTVEEKTQDVFIIKFAGGVDKLTSSTSTFDDFATSFNEYVEREGNDRFKCAAQGSGADKYYVCKKIRLILL